MANWPLVALGNLAALDDSAIAIGPFGSRMKTDTYVDSGVAVIRGQNITDDGHLTGNFVYVSEEFASSLGPARLLPGDIVLPHRGAIGRAALVPEGDYVMSTSLMRIRLDRTRAFPAYVRSYLCSDAGRQEILKFASTVGTPGIGQPLTSLRQIRVPLAPMNEQRRIAGVLGVLDDLIDTNRALMEHCALQIRSQYRRMMATAKTELRPFFDVFNVDFGAPFKGSAFNTVRDGRPLLRIRDLKTFTSDIWTTEQRHDETIISPGDIVVGMDAEFRPTLWLGAPSLLNQRVCRIRAKAAGLAFTREALVAPLAYIEGHKTGTTVSHLNKRDLAEIKVNVPTQKALTQFETVAEPLRGSIVELKRETDTLADACDELLPLLLSRRVRIDEVAA